MVPLVALDGSNDWPLLCTSFNMTLNGPPTTGPTASADRTDQDHLIMEVKVVQQLVLPVTCLVAIGAKPSQCRWVEHPVGRVGLWQMRTAHRRADPCGCATFIMLSRQQEFDIGSPDGRNVSTFGTDLLGVMKLELAGVWKITDGSNLRVK